MNTKHNLFIVLYLITSKSIFSLNHPDHPDCVLIIDDLNCLNDIDINMFEKALWLPAYVNMAEALSDVVLYQPREKTYESLICTYVTPLHYPKALLLLGFDPGNNMPEDENNMDAFSNCITNETLGDSVLIFVQTMVEVQRQRHPVGLSGACCNKEWNIDTKKNKLFTDIIVKLY